MQIKGMGLGWITSGILLSLWLGWDWGLGCIALGMSFLWLEWGDWGCKWARGKYMARKCAWGHEGYQISQKNTKGLRHTNRPPEKLFFPT